MTDPREPKSQATNELAEGVGAGATAERAARPSLPFDRASINPAPSVPTATELMGGFERRRTRSGTAFIPATERIIVSLSPATGKLLGQVRAHSTNEILDLVTSAREAQRAWGDRSVAERCRVLSRVGGRLADDAESIVSLLVSEVGKPRFEALSHEVLPALDLIRYYTSKAPQILAESTLRSRWFPQRVGTLRHLPRGVVASIAPWNYPLLIPLGDAIAALAAGNAVVIKASEHTPLTAARLVQLLRESGVPEALVHVVHGGPEAALALLRAEPDFVRFTGGLLGGRAVAQACAALTVPCTLELGGKAAAIVCADADVERAAQSIVWGAFANAGQTCIGVERVLAHRSVYDALLKQLKRRIERLRVGDPNRDNVDMGPLINDLRRVHIEALIEEARIAGAQILTGGGRVEGAGYFFQPTLLAAARSDMRVMNDEIFGPCLPVMAVDSDEQALIETNRLPYGLMGYVFSRDRARAQRLAEHMQCGTVMINEVLLTYAMPEAPFGGIRKSGYGYVHGEEGLRSLCVQQHVNRDRFPLASFGFPYSERLYRRLMRGARLITKATGGIRLLP